MCAWGACGGSSILPSPTIMSYQLAALGGTFDHFHDGHKELISFAFTKAQKIIIGITEPFLSENKELSFLIQSYEDRVDSVNSFLYKIGKLEDATIFPLKDSLGPTLENFQIDLLVCSPLTKTGSIFINSQRQKQKLPILPIEVCQMKKAQNGEYISSTRIRRGEINRDGFVYQNLFSQDIKINSNLKNLCQKPFGTLLKNPSPELINSQLNSHGLNLVVGDIVSNFFIKNNLPARSFIFDQKTKRKILDFSPSKEITTSNLAGEIKVGFAQDILIAFWQQKNLFVKGEEDLAVIPATLLLPLDTKIFYGQPNEGIVVTTVTEENKEILKNLLTVS